MTLNYILWWGTSRWTLGTEECLFIAIVPRCILTPIGNNIRVPSRSKIELFYHLQRFIIRSSWNNTSMFKLFEEEYFVKRITNVKWLYLKLFNCVQTNELLELVRK